jgi:pyruvate/2-oxoglutarate dehydrogenase complex dihydrolipoamide dehydrogenase (E3) component/uncharacterized membrane protein YdjX (TVP38/TMEM64 family)
MKRKLALLALLALLLALFWFSGLSELLTLATLKQKQAELARVIAAHPLLSLGAYFVLYVAVTAVSLPGAAVLTLGAGALFGLVAGTLVTSLAATIGATLAFLSARFLFREPLQARYGDRLAAVEEGIRRDGAFYLFSLRLIPVFPFFLVNLLAGLTAMPARVFAPVSLVGMLPGSLVYVNAGTQLAEIGKASDILSLPLLLSFVALAMLPWLGKLLAGWLRRRRLYARFRRPRQFDRNLVVIGAGAAGLVTAYVAAAVKAKVTLVEKARMGGDCLHTGCVPSKALIRAAKTAQQVREAHQFGIDAAITGLRFGDILRRVERVIADIAPHDSVERYSGLGVDVVQGEARIVDPWRVEIRRGDGQVDQLTTRAIVIATGARPFVPSLPGLDVAGYVTSETLWETLARHEVAPGRVAILGGGPIGCEMAQALARLGSHVSLLEAADRLMTREDAEVSAFAEMTLRADGVDVLTSHRALSCHLENGERVLVAECGGLRREIAFDLLVVAVGRVARLEGFGLEELGIPTHRVVETNAYLETVFPNILAAGDVAGPYQLTHAAGHQGWHAAVNALFSPLKRFRVDYASMPATTFLDPEIARVGLNETEARAKGIAYDLTRYDLDDLDRAIADGKTKGFVKVLTVPGRDRILGATIVGAEAGELLAEFTLAMRHRLGLNAILSTIHAYPTLAEANKYAAGQWKRAHAPAFALKLLEMFHRFRRGGA